MISLREVERGVLQGEALSPMLFSMYLNDFEVLFSIQTVVPLS